MTKIMTGFREAAILRWHAILLDLEYQRKHIYRQPYRANLSRRITAVLWILKLLEEAK